MNLTQTVTYESDEGRVNLVMGVWLVCVRLTRLLWTIALHVGLWARKSTTKWGPLRHWVICFLLPYPAAFCFSHTDTPGRLYSIFNHIRGLPWFLFFFFLIMRRISCFFLQHLGYIYLS